MAQEHFDRLTAIDASFLHQEGPNSHMHVGGVARFEGPPPPFDELLDSLRMRLHLVPRYRQRLQVPPAGTGRPLWVDDPTFNIEYHVRHTALPRPGSDRQLLELTGRIFSQQLDRARPLWEVWMVEGLADGGFALVSKSHHAMIDGIAGVDIAQVLFDLVARARRRARTPTRRGSPPASRARPRSWRPGRSGSCARACGPRPTRRACCARPAPRSPARARRPRASARSSGPASTPRPRRRSTSRSARTAATRSCAPRSTTSSSSRTRSAGR